VQATVLIATLFIVIANLLTDIAYSVVDPRVRLG
jgi:peptide/nickel transport system permease protein